MQNIRVPIAERGRLAYDDFMPFALVRNTLIAGLLLACGCAKAPPDIVEPQTTRSATVPEKIDVAGLPNAYRLNAKVVSGGQPDGEAAFRALQELGIKTVISVDGAKPDVAGAKKYGLRYVHLPHGYDGIPNEQVLALAKAVRDLPGPIYIHCHYGKHRSPAAATAACVATGLLAPADGPGVLKTAGTSPNYRGLYESVASAHRVADDVLDALDVEFRETAELPPMAEAMVSIEHTHDRLKSIAKSSWQPTAEHPDLDPAHEALMLKESFAELARTEDARRQLQEFQEMLRDSTTAAGDLEAALRTTGDGSRLDSAALDAGFERITQRCAACHRTFRDVPLSEKQAH